MSLVKIRHCGVITNKFSKCLGKFRWAETNQLAEYTNWIEGEPNNQYGDQDCVQDMHPCLKEETNADMSGQNFGVF